MQVAIVGAGIFGLAAALELRRRGRDVSVFERGRVPSERASSTDLSKTIRRFYGENPTYVELAERAAPQWRVWQERLGGEFYFPIGQIQIERDFRGGKRLHDSFEFFRRRGDPAVELISPRVARERFPQFAIHDDDTCTFDAWAGYLASGRALAGLARLARSEGVNLREETPVSAIEESPTGVHLTLPAATASFDRVVVATGVWLPALVPWLRPYFRPTFQQMAFFEPASADRDAFAAGALPVWSVDVQDEGWYGHPLKSEGWVKVSNDLLGEIVDADVDRQAMPAFLEAAREFVARRMPALARGKLVGSRACLYENTPDRDFLIDWVPGHQRVLVAGGGSGHGFKFGGSIGPVIADALEDKENRLGDQFRIGRRFGDASM